MRPSQQVHFLSYLNEVISLYPQVDFEKELTAFKKSANPMSLAQLAAKLNLCPVELWDQKIDLETLQQQNQNNVLALPARYRDGMFSSTTSLNNILQPFERRGLKKWVLNKLQIHPGILDGHRPLSVLAAADVLQIGKQVLSTEELNEVGEINSKAFMTKQFGLEIRKSPNLRHLYLNFCETIRLMEQNWDYEIVRDEHTRIIVRTKNSAIMRDYADGEDYSSPLTTGIRLAFIRELASSIGYGGVEVYPVTSQEADGKFEFAIDLSHAFKLSSESVSRQGESLAEHSRDQYTARFLQ